MPAQGMSPQVRLRDMSVVFIECKTFHAEFPDWVDVGYACCGDCHSRINALIYVRPFKPEYPSDSNADWSLCIEALICCKIYDMVRALPREWWVKKAKEYGVYRDDSRGYIYSDSPEKNTERPAHARTVSATIKTERAKAVIRRQQEEEEEGGLDAYLARRRR